MKWISINVKQPMYTVINTTEYNDDGVANVTVCKLNELKSIGFDSDDIKRIKKLNIGESLNDTWVDNSVVVVRIG